MSNGFTSMPVPWPFAPFYQPQAERVIEQQPPQRVKVAMEYLYYLASKTTDKAAPHGLGCEVIDGQKAAPAETAAQTAACELLRNYFRGDLEPDWYEEAIEMENLPPGGTLLNCPVCNEMGGKPREDCPVCKGCGQIIVSIPERK